MSAHEDRDARLEREREMRSEERDKARPDDKEPRRNRFRGLESPDKKAPRRKGLLGLELPDERAPRKATARKPRKPKPQGLLGGLGLGLGGLIKFRLGDLLKVNI